MTSSGFTSSQAIADAVHKVMVSEAVDRFARPRAGLVAWLERHPQRVRELVQYQQVARDLVGLPISILDCDRWVHEQGSAISAETGLLTNDALIVALMRRAGLVDIASNDADFLTVPGLRVWMPREAEDAAKP